MDRHDPYLQRASAMPTMPEVAQRLLRSFDRDDLSLGQLAALVNQDATLAAKVLRLANSARYSPSRNIALVQEAAACLGLQTLRDLSLAASLCGAFPEVPGLDRRRFWRDNLAIAGYAQVLARALDADAEVAYIGGLMLRSGQVLMAMVSPEPMAGVFAHAGEIDGAIAYESSLLATTHPTITAALARHWRFPDTLVSAFAAAADPLAARPFDRLGAVLRLASVVTDALDRGCSASDGLQQAQPALLQHLQLDLDWVEAHLPDHASATAGAELLLR